MDDVRIDLDWTRMLGFNHAPKSDGVTVAIAKVGLKPVDKPQGASAGYCIAGLGAMIGSKNWVRLTD
jgi:hypothetical protein